MIWHYFVSVKSDIIIRMILLFYLSLNKRRSLAAGFGVTVPVERRSRTDGALGVVTD